MSEFKDILVHISDGKDLSESQATMALEEILKGHISASHIAAFLFGMSCKGETIEELTGFVKAMRKACVEVVVDTKNAVDLCGTGGDKSGTFNISTAAMFVVSGAQVPVLKHGNSSVSSNSGSFDVLKMLGAEPDLIKEQVETCFHETDMAFMFAPRFHPAMAHVMPVRKALGVRTFFNIMGPMLNPAHVKRQVIGTFHRDVAEKIIKIMSLLESDFIYALHADDGLDEFSTTASTYVYQLHNKKISDCLTIDASSFGYQAATLDDLKGGDPTDNASIICSVLNNEATIAQKEIVLLNSAFAIHASGLYDDLNEAFLKAEESLESGDALKALNRFAECTSDLKSS